MEILAVAAVLGGIMVSATSLFLVSRLFARGARLRRQAQKTPIRPIREARRGELIRVRGQVRSSDAPLRLPFSGDVAVYHVTQLVDSSNPHGTDTFTRGDQREFFVDDGTGTARVPREAALELVERAAPRDHAIDRADPAVAEFLGNHRDDLFSKAGPVLWTQRAIRIGDYVTVWGRVLLEPDTDASHHQGHFREEPLRVLLVPLAADGAVVVEPATDDAHPRGASP